ncbi:MAG: hypothetical protein IJR47_00720 [Clostridia bacterium]|nr:hypothetical protein [Clostridia bacterium]
MKKLFSAFLAFVLIAALTGCGGGNSSKKATEKTTTEKTTTAMKKPEITQSDKPASIVRKSISREITTDAKFSYNSKYTKGVLTLNKESFVFTAENGNMFEFPLNSILLAVVDHTMDEDGDVLGFFVQGDQFAFTVRDGYIDEISEFLVISETVSTLLQQRFD